mgnify:CR=1 FL=1
MNRRPLVQLCILTALGGVVTAQAEGEAIDPSAKAAKAIADYEAVKGDAQKVAQKRRALLWVGDIDHADVTTFLQKELQEAGNTAFAATVCEAIGKVERPQIGRAHV